MKKITVLGLWHQGVVAAACLAELGYRVVGLDGNAGLIANLKDGKAPLYEPGLNELIVQGLNSGNLYFSSNFEECLIDCDVLLVSYDTEVDNNDVVLLDKVISDFQFATTFFKNNLLIHVTAQVPVGTSRRLIQIVKNARPSLKFHLAYTPENLRLGNAIDLYRNPTLPVIGCDDPGSFTKFEKIYSRFNVNWLPCNLETAEMTKHGLNGFLATSISFGNELGNLCSMVGANGHLVAKFLKLEPRIGSRALLTPGLAFGGGTLARDVQVLRAIGDKNDYETFFLNGLWEANNSQNNIIIRKIKECFGGSLVGVSVCILGLTYKPKTSTLRRSPSLEIIKKLIEDGALVVASDPMAELKDLPELKKFTFHRNVNDAIKGADVIIVMTPWDDYKKLSPLNVLKMMSNNVIFDAASIWLDRIDHNEELRYITIGDGESRKRIES